MQMPEKKYGVLNITGKIEKDERFFIRALD
jgi:hypothetical protein